MLEARRALYTEIPEKRQLDDEQLAPERQALDSTSKALPGFTILADYIDVYPPDSRFAKSSRSPLRVLVDADHTTTALVFRPPPFEIVRIRLITELGDGRWLLTENNKNEPVAKLARPVGFEVVHVLKSTSPAAMISAHADRLRELLGTRDSSTYRDAAAPTAIQTFEDYVASHTRRWDAIRKHRKEIGWMFRSEISMAPGAQPDDADRIYAEIVRIRDAEADS